MDTYLTIPYDALVEIPSPHLEPRLAFQALEPRKVDSLTLIDGKTFSATNVSGDVYPPGSPDVGFFHDDTRFLSHLELRSADIAPWCCHRRRKRPSPHKSNSPPATSRCVILSTCPKIPSTFVVSSYWPRKSSLIRLTLENFNLTPVDFTVEVVFDADFVDVFQVRGLARQQHGQYYQPIVGDNSITFYYRGLDGIMRQTLIKLDPRPIRFRSVWPAGSFACSR